MRVLCIDAARRPGCMSCPPEIVEGETYTVRGEKFGDNGIPCYKLVETRLAYGKFRFIPCSDQDNLVLEDVLLEVNNK